ncbi:MAG TPA: aldose epimerase family protein [Lacipirellulaceae bacterium]|nr:aldose epimerase family protein [Lacipirellulaceae bacterium]
MHFHATSPSGLRAKWITRGATLAELHVPDAHGETADVVLGFDDEAGYRTIDNQSFGCTTGRVCNRIAAGRFTLDGVEYQLAVNNGVNHLHGGPERSLQRVEWQGESFADEQGMGVRFHYTSPDGEEGYPGVLDVTTTYTLTPGGALRIDYLATTDRATHVNLTNHSYFNLSGHGTASVLDHQLWIGAERYTPKDETSIPTGELAPVAGTPFDFRTRRAIGAEINKLTGHESVGYDHNYVLDGPPGAMRLAATLFDPASGRTMRVHTDQPGLQFYTANYVRGQTGKGGQTYRKHGSVCLETQRFPNAPNTPHFPSTVLRPGETYRHTCVYEFQSEPPRA